MVGPGQDLHAHIKVVNTFVSSKKRPDVCLPGRFGLAHLCSKVVLVAAYACTEG